MLSLENLEFIALAITEDEQSRGEGIQPKADLHHGRQPINGFSHVRGPAGQVHAPC